MSRDPEFSLVTIIGAGPAGLAAALQLQRYGISPQVLEKDEVGGLLRNANLVENYLGFPTGISGRRLIDAMRKQVAEVGVQVSYEQVKHVEPLSKGFLTVTDIRAYHSRFLVVASGTKPKPLTGIHISQSVLPRLYYEVYPLEKHFDGSVVIVGAGDAAFDYALNLASRRNKVIILNRSAKPKCLPLLWSRAASNPLIDYYAETVVQELSLDDQGKCKVIAQDRDSNWRVFQSDVIIAAVGREPALDFLPLGWRNFNTRQDRMEGLFFVGDVKNGLYRQTAIATGDGIRAAMQISQLLEEEKK